MEETASRGVDFRVSLILRRQKTLQQPSDSCEILNLTLCEMLLMRVIFQQLRHPNITTLKISREGSIFVRPTASMNDFVRPK